MLRVGKSILNFARNLSFGERGGFLELDCADRAGIARLGGFLEFQICGWLTSDKGNSAGPCEFSLEYGGGYLSAEIAINTLFSNKIFTNPFWLLSYAFLETWWCRHETRCTAALRNHIGSAPDWRYGVWLLEGWRFRRGRSE
jgi:hypothetical protein